MVQFITNFYGKCENSQNLENSIFFNNHISGTTQRRKTCFTILKFAHSQLKNETLWIKISKDLTNLKNSTPWRKKSFEFFFLPICIGGLKAQVAIVKGLFFAHNSWRFMGQEAFICTIQLPPSQRWKSRKIIKSYQDLFRDTLNLTKRIINHVIEIRISIQKEA